MIGDLRSHKNENTWCGNVPSAIPLIYLAALHVNRFDAMTVLLEFNTNNWAIEFSGNAAAGTAVIRYDIANSKLHKFDRLIPKIDCKGKLNMIICVAWHSNYLKIH